MLKKRGKGSRGQTWDRGEESEKPAQGKQQRSQKLGCGGLRVLGMQKVSREGGPWPRQVHIRRPGLSRLLLPAVPPPGARERGKEHITASPQAHWCAWWGGAFTPIAVVTLPKP